MLEHVHIVNFVLIDDIDIDFGPGLNILTGETGAGKSIILGSINLALGAKADKNYIRKGADYAYIEMVFSIDNEKQKEVLHSLDIYPDDNLIVISRKIMENKSIARVCGEAVSNHNLKLISSIFLDVYGQRDYQVLLRNEMHISILDDYIGSDLNSTLSDYKNTYEEYLKVKSSLADLEAMLKNKDKEMSLLEYQVDEIEKANLHKGEEEEIKAFLDVAENSKKILDVLNKVNFNLKDNNVSVSSLMNDSLKEVSMISDISKDLNEIYKGLSDADAILSDIGRKCDIVAESLDLDPASLEEARERYNLIDELERKYGNTIDDVLLYLNKIKADYDKFTDVENLYNETNLKLKKAFDKLQTKGNKLTELRKKKAVLLEKEIIKVLKELNFNDSRFQISISPLDDYSQDGIDDVVFLVATNKGEDLKEVSFVASGGELSRIMLAIKSVTADNDHTGTLIFDEIDAGISGNAAWSVGKKLKEIASNHQVLCITHLPQIAAMSDKHFYILKEEEKGKTVTHINVLDEEGIVEEIARLSGGGSSSKLQMESAKELRERAKEY
jgi:DNA repair protein RecN (Recombination protein N)